MCLIVLMGILYVVVIRGVVVFKFSFDPKMIILGSNAEIIHSPVLKFILDDEFLGIYFTEM